MPFYQEFSAHWLPKIESALAACMSQAARELIIGKAGEYALMGPGKRIRPLLTLMAADACDSAPENAMPAAMAVEMVHAFSLVHDDLPCMDDDDLRRGRPTTHKVFGEAMAVLAGDALLASAFQKLCMLPSDVTARCAQALSFASVMMAEGQAMDITGFEKTPSVEDLDRLNGYKTGALIECALQMGGIVAGADDAHLKALVDYGHSLGLAFQITDDLLDATGNEESAGKKVGKDASKGKKTYPAVLGVDESRKRSEELVRTAVKSLRTFDARADHLRDLAESILHRDR